MNHSLPITRYSLLATCLVVLCLPTYIHSQSYIEQTYNNGVNQFQDGNYKSAIETFDEVLSTATKKDKDFTSKAQLYKANSLSELLLLDDAMSVYMKITEKFPNTNESLRARLGIGLIHYKKNNYESAREYFLGFMKRFPNTKITDDAQYWLGMLHFKNKNFKKAVISFTALVQNYPNSDYTAEGWLRLGDTYFNLKKYTQARNSYRKVLSKCPSSVQAEFALYGVGRTYNSQGETFDEIMVYTQFVEKYPTSQLSPEIIYQVAVYFYKKKNYDNATKYFEQLSSSFPDHNLSEESNFMRSKIYYKTDDKVKSIDSFRMFVEKYPSSKNRAEALLYIGDCYFDFADYKNAVENYEKGMKLELSDTEIFAMAKYNCGLSHEKVGNSTEAGKCFNEILYRYPKSVAAAKMYLKRGIDLEVRGDYFAAVENYELAANISKNKSIQKTESLSNSMKEDIGATAQKKAADCYFVQKKYKEASREYLKVVYLFNSSEYVPEAQYMAACASEETGYLKEAKQNYEAVAKKYSNTEWANKAKERLAVLRSGK